MNIQSMFTTSKTMGGVRDRGVGVIPLHTHIIII